MLSQLHLTLYSPVDCSLPGSCACGIVQARILEWVAISTPGDLPDPGIHTPGDLPDPGIKPTSLASLASAGEFFTTVPPGKPLGSVLFSSVAQSCLTLCDPMNRSTPGLPVHHQLPEVTQTHAHRVGDASSHLILCRPLLLPPPIPPSIRVFSIESAFRMRWPKYWSFSLSISSSNEHPGLISFRMDWLDLLAVILAKSVSLNSFFFQMRIIIIALK